MAEIQTFPMYPQAQFMMKFGETMKRIIRLLALFVGADIGIGYLSLYVSSSQSFANILLLGIRILILLCLVFVIFLHIKFMLIKMSPSKKTSNLFSKITSNITFKIPPNISSKYSKISSKLSVLTYPLQNILAIFSVILMMYFLGFLMSDLIYAGAYINAYSDFLISCSFLAYMLYFWVESKIFTIITLRIIEPIKGNSSSNHRVPMMESTFTIFKSQTMIIYVLNIIIMLILFATDRFIPKLFALIVSANVSDALSKVPIYYVYAFLLMIIVQNVGIFELIRKLGNQAISGIIVQ